MSRLLRVCSLIFGLLSGFAYAGVDEQPAVKSTSNGCEATDTTSHTITLPATIEANDLLCVYMGVDAGATVTWDNSSHGTWTELWNSAFSSFVRGVGECKVADGTEDSGTLTITTGASEESCWLAEAIGPWGGNRNWDIDTANDRDVYLVSGNQSGSSSTPNCKPSTDTLGTIDRRTTCVVMSAQTNSCDVTGYPSGYNDDQHAGKSSADDPACIGSAGRRGREEEQDPGSFTLAANARSYIATMSIRGGYEYFGKKQIQTTDRNVNYVEAQGGTMPATSDMVLDGVCVYADGTPTSNIRLAVYQGGSLSTGPDNATLVEDLGVTDATGETTEWICIESATNPSLTASAVTWVALKGNDSGFVTQHTTSSSLAEDYQTANGRYQSSVVSSDETVAWASTWPTDSGSFANFWYSTHLMYTIGAAPTAPPRMTLMGVGP